MQHVVFETKKLDNAKQQETDTVKVNPLFNTHLCTAILTRADQSQRSLTMLRDSGSLQPLISRDKLSAHDYVCLLYTSPSPRDRQKSRMPSSA